MRALQYLALALAACGDGKVEGATRELVATLPVTPTSDLDVLFVVDDTAPVQQGGLAAGFPAFLNRLQAPMGGLPNLHIGVATSDMGTKGSQDPTPGPPVGQVGNGGCMGTGKDGALQTFGAPVNGTFISDVAQPDGSRFKNYTGDLAAAFTRMAEAGAGGCGFEQTLHGMRRALEDNAANTGFLRPEATIAVLVVTDEDDCSATDPALFSADTATLGPQQSFRCTHFGVTCSVGGTTPDEMITVGTKSGCGANPTSTVVDNIVPYADFLKSLKSDPSRVVVGGVMAPADPFAIELRTPPGGGTPLAALANSCHFQTTTGLAAADPAPRLAQFLAQFPDRAVSTTACQVDFSAMLTQFATLANQALGNPCLTRPVADTDAAMPGTQADCVVTARSGGATTEIPPCGSGPCWRIEEHDLTCIGLEGSKLVVEGADGFSADTVFEARCVTDHS